MAPQQLTSAALIPDSPYTRPPVATVPEVLDRLEEIQAHAEAHEPRGQHDGVACFSYLYLTITREVWEGINAGRFTDGEFVTALDVTFANRYLSALRAHARSEPAVPDAWAALFERRSNRRITRLQFAAAGVNAHVNFDLAVAVADTCRQLGSEPNAGTKHESYREINRIFAEQMQTLREHFESTWERLIDKVAFAHVLNRVDDWTVVISRDVAWEAAEHLWNLRTAGSDESEFLDQLDDLAADVGRLVLTPVL